MFVAIVVCALLGAQAFACPAEAFQEVPEHTSPPLTDRAVFQAWATGGNQHGQLGLGFTSYGHDYFTKVPRLKNPIAIASGGAAEHSLALMQDGTVRAAGWNEVGQLGLGDWTDRKRFAKIPGLKNVAGIAVGNFHSFAILASGRVRGAGTNLHGQLGLGDARRVKRFTKVPGLRNVVAIAADDNYSLALTKGGRIWATGRNTKGQLGLGKPGKTYRKFRRVPDLKGVVAVAVGHWHSLALKRNGTVWATGSNHSGQLGLGDASGCTRFTKVPGLKGVTAIAAGIDSHSLALLGNGRLRATGNNWDGQLGLGDSKDRSRFTKVPGIRDVVSIAAGFGHSLVRTKNKRVWGAGSNYYGQLGLTGIHDRARFVEVPNVTRVKAIAAGGWHSLLLRRQ